MAERDIVGGMFGVTPEMYQRSMAARDSANNLTAASQLTPGQLSGYYAMEAGTGLGRATQGLLGVEDPQLSLIRQTNQLVQQIGVDTPEKLQTLASELQKIPGGGQLAMQAIDKANQMMKTGAEAQTAQQKIDQEKLLREELSKLPEDASDEDMLKVFRKFGTPDQQGRAIQASLDKKAALEQKKVLADLKTYEAQKTQQGKVQAITDNADRIINTIDQAIPLVGYTTAGLAGAANIPGTEGRDLETALTTIKANLGFDRLQQMRDASKTGGALGQVAVKELEALQATVASLDRGQSPDKLRENLKDIKYYYDRWRKAVGGEDPGPAVRKRDSETKAESKAKQTQPAATGGWSVVTPKQ
jgi:hypothetical protein